MSKCNRNGERKPRTRSNNLRVPELGYYFIVTDTKETEKNYMRGLRDSIPPQLREKLVIKVIKTETKSLVAEAMNMSSLNPQYGETWIIFDRDQVKDFDLIIEEAESNGIKVGWANPCIEVWLHAYFGSMPSCLDSVNCCDHFGTEYAKRTGIKYEKSDKDLYSRLMKYGDEDKAIAIAEQRYHQLCSCNATPSSMVPCTTIHTLVKEIKSKIK